MAIKKLNSRELPNDRHLGFMEQVSKVLSPYSYEGQPVYEERKAALAAAIKAEDDAYKQSQKNFNTDKMHAEDALRDSYMQAARSIISGYALLPDTEPKKQQAMELLQVWKDYKFSTSDSYTGESVKIDNMWQVLEKKENVLTSMGVLEILQKAVEHNSQVKALFEIRNEQKSAIVVGALKAARQVSDTAYREVVEILDAMDVVKPGTVQPEIVRQLTELAEYYTQYYLNRRKSSAEEGGEIEEEVEAEN